MSHLADTRTDVELLAAGPEDPDAFAVFYRRHARDVVALARRLAAPAEAGDLVAEVFATALVHRRRYDPARGTAGAWLTGIALNKLADARRRGALDARLCHRLGIHVPTLALDPDLEAELPALLDELPADQRQALVARILEGKPYDLIAREQASSEPAVRKRVSRALAALRGRLQEEQT